jgi:hydrophobe/amphiphile efflux-3 (HAE3) family protein
MTKRISQLVTRVPWLIIIVFVSISLFIGSFARKAEIDPEVKNQLPADFPSRINIDKIEDIFGGTEMVMVLIEAEDVLDPSTLKRSREISRRMDRLSEFDRVLSLFELKDIRGESGEMLVDPAVKRIPRSGEEREKLRQDLKDNDLVYGNVVSYDFKATAVIGMVRLGVSDVEALEAVDDLLAEVPGPEPVVIAGMPFVRNSVETNIQQDLRAFIPFGLLIMLVFLFACFRQLRGVVLPFLVVVMSILLTMGLIPLLGLKITVVIVLLPVMMIAIANNYGIHLIARYQEENHPGNELTSRELAGSLVRALGKPILATAVTTMGGMLCLLSHVMISAQELGVLASIGIGFAFLGSILFIPAVISVLPKSRPIIDLKNRSAKLRPLDRALRGLARLVAARPKSVIAATLAVVAITSTGIALVVVDANPINYYEEDSPVARSANMVNDHFGGTTSLSLVATGDIKDPEVLKKIDRMERDLEELPGVGLTTSLARVVRRMNKVMNDGNPEFDRVPDTRDAIAQYLLLYSMSGDPDDFDRLVDFPYENAQVVARINTLSTPEMSRVVKKTRELIQNIPDSPFTIVGGFAVLFDDFVREIINGQIRSLALSLLVIGLLVAILFRSATAGALAFLVMAMAMAMLFGLIGFLEIELNIATAMLSSIMIGVGVDYTIHYLWRYREERARGLDCQQAVVSTLTTVGRGIVFNALSVVVGFVVLLFSAFLPVKFFGFLVVVSISVCLAGAMVLLPAITVVFRPAFLEPASGVLSNDQGG